MTRPPDRPSRPVKAELVETLTLSELCHATAVPAAWVEELVAHGVLDPRGPESRTWRFEARSLAIVTRAHRLHRDLGLNMEGTALALSLLDEAEALRARVAQLEAALAARDR